MKKEDEVQPPLNKNQQEYAEEELSRQTAGRQSPDPTALSIEETQRLLHELQVHQIELEMQNEELRRVQLELETSRAQHFDLFDLAPVGFLILNEQGLILEANLTFTKLLDVTRSKLIKRPLSRFISPEDQGTYYRFRKQLSITGIPQEHELRLVKKDGAPLWVWLQTSASRDADDAPIYLAVLTDITDRKQAETYREMGREILQLLNEPGDTRSSIQRVIAVLKTRTGFDAVGLRLQDGDDFPYFSQQGFPQDFLLLENTLAERAPDGGLCRDQDGRIRLECTCGLVISDRTDPANPLFTAGGSFWTNDSFPILNIPPNEDPRYHPRNQCIHHGYASIALVPIRNQDRVVGLIQLNDRRKGCFALNTVELLEGIAVHIGAALMRKQTEEALRQSEKRFRTLFEQAAVGVALLETGTGRYVEINQRYCDFLGYTKEEMLASKFQAVTQPDDVQINLDNNALLIAGKIKEFSQEKRYIRRDGTVVWGDLTGSPLWAEGEEPETYFHIAVVQDITRRKQAEEALRESQANLAALIENTDNSIWSVDAHYRLITANAAFHAELLAHFERDIGQSESVLSDSIPQAVRDQWQGYYDRALRNEHFEIEIQLHSAARPRYKTYQFNPIKTTDEQIKGVVVIGQEITERKLLANTQLFLAQYGLNGGRDFFESLARHLAETLQMDYVCINRLEAGHMAAHTVAVYFDGQFEENVTYILQDTPCGAGVGQASCCFPAGVRHLFPRDEALQEMMAESYSSVTLYSSQGQPIGLIVAIGRRPLANPSLAEAILKLATARAAGELERRQVEAALRDSETRYHSIVEDQTELICRYLPDGRLSFTNQAYARYYGKTPSEFLNTNFIPHIPEPDLSMILRRIAEITPQEPAVNFEHRFIQPDGGIRWQRWTHRGIYSPAGELIEYQAVGRDITERKRAEQRINSLAKFPAENPNPVLRLEPGGVILYANEASQPILQAWGCAVGEAIPEWWRTVVAKVFVEQAGKTFDVELGDRFWSFFITPIPQANYLNLYASDITERKRAEDALRQAHDELEMRVEQRTFENGQLYQAERRRYQEAEALRQAALSLTSTIDLDQLLERILVELQKVVPYDSASVQLIKDDQLEIIAGRGFKNSGDVVGLQLPIRSELTPNALVLKSLQPLVIDNAATHPFWIKHELIEAESIQAWLGVPLVINNRPVGIITLDKHQPQFYTLAHAQLAQAYAAQAAIAIENARLYRDLQNQIELVHMAQFRLRQSERMAAVGRLMASIAHEINNPLQSIQGFLNLLGEELVDRNRPEKITKYLHIVDSEIDRVVEIVRRMREFYSPDRKVEDFYGSTQNEFQPVELHTILDSVLTLANKTLQQYKITVNRVWADSLPAIQANPSLLKQVFLNLILNAADAMAEGGGTLRVQTALVEAGLPEQDPPSPAVHLEFSDTGIGMSPEVMTRLFEPMFSTKEHGTGFGLFTSYQIIEAHHGQIAAANQPGQGATFAILLPVDHQQG